MVSRVCIERVQRLNHECRYVWHTYRAGDPATQIKSGFKKEWWIDFLFISAYLVFFPNAKHNPAIRIAHMTGMKESDVFVSDGIGTAAVPDEPENAPDSET